jgi:hypothetical protein
MLGGARRLPPRDPQAGVAFRPTMLVHAGSLSEVAPHRIGRIEDDDAPARSTLLPWTLAMAGLMAAFFLGTSWSASPQVRGVDACLATAPAPAAPPSKHGGGQALR